MKNEAAPVDPVEKHLREIAADPGYGNYSCTEMRAALFLLTATQQEVSRLQTRIAAITAHGICSGLEVRSLEDSILLDWLEGFIRFGWADFGFEPDGTLLLRLQKAAFPGNAQEHSGTNLRDLLRVGKAAA